LLLPRIVAFALPYVPDAYYREALAWADAYFTPSYFTLLAAASALTLVVMFERRATVAYKLVLAGLVAVMVLSAYVVPVGAAIQQEPIKEAAQLAREQGLNPILWRLNAPSFSVYRGQPTEIREPAPGDVVLTRAQRLEQLPGLGYEVLYAKHGIVLVRIHG